MALNETQKKFRREIEKAKNIKTYKEILDDHNDFYHNTTYENEVLEKYYKKEKNKRRIFYICILGIIIFFSYKNIDKIDFDKIKNNIEKSKMTIVEPGTNDNRYNNYNVTDDDKKQYEMGKYQNEYSDRIETIGTIANNNFNIEKLHNFEIEKLNEQLIVINDLIDIFNNYTPESVNDELHQINKNILQSYKNKYEYALILSNNYSDINAVNNFNNANNEINFYNNFFREKIIVKFKEINMTYKIEENKIIFTYKDLKY